MCNVKTMKVTIDTYRLGEPNINPIIQSYRGRKSYPYVMRDSFTEEKVKIEYEAIELENEYLKVVILPEIGGRLYSAYDKRSGEEIFYKNNVMKPQLIGLTGAWVSGGIEFNFPNGHRPSTMELVDTAYRKNADGSVSAFIGEIDKITGLAFSVEIILREGYAYVEQITRIYNPTEVAHKFFMWNTASAKGHIENEYRYPFKWHIDDEYIGTRSLWPMYKDKNWDYRFEKEYVAFGSVFGDNVKEDFFGSYDPVTNTGMVHVSGFRDVPGKKMWTWGHLGQGVKWNQDLTDDDGDYIEIQSGNVETQEDFRDLQPLNGAKWSEYWFGAFDTGKYTYASVNNIITVRLEEKGTIKLFLDIASNRNISNAVVEISNDTGTLFEGKVDLDVYKKFSKEIDIKSDIFVKGNVELRIFEDGILIDEYVIKENDRAIDAISKEADIRESFNYKLDKEEKGLILIAANLMRKKRYAEAEEMLFLEWQKNEVDDQLCYYLGCCRYLQGKYDKALDVLHYVGNHSFYFSAGCAISGYIYLSKKKYLTAISFFKRAIEENKYDRISFTYLAYTYEKIGKVKDAVKVLEYLLEEDPTDLIAMQQLSLITGEKIEDIFAKYNYTPRLAVEDIFEVVNVYHRIGDYDKAIAVCEKYEDISSLLSYQLAYYYDITGEQDKAKKEVKKAEGMSLGYVFPNKEISKEAFEYLRDKYDMPKGIYLLGLIYCFFADNEKSVECMEEVREKLKYSVLNRNLAFIYTEENEVEKAAEVYKEGIDFKPFNGDIFYLYNALLFLNDMGEDREWLHRRLEKVENVHQQVVLTKLSCYLKFDMLDEFFKLANEYKFRSWEIDVGDPKLTLRIMYHEARLAKARNYMDKDMIDEAIEELNLVYEYPENSGIGIKYGFSPLKTYEYLMACYEQKADYKKVLEYAHKTVEVYKDMVNEKNKKKFDPYYAKAMNKITELNWLGVY